MLASLLNFTSLVQSSGLAAVFLLSVAQSCCVPTSSELTLGFAGVLAAEGHLNLVAVIVVAAFGELVGALVAWVIGRTVGRPVVDRWGKYILLSHRDLDRVEDWYDRHQRWGVFGSRLLPVIRNFVALPAGIAEVPIVRFGVLTFLGSLIWDAAMALIGYEVGSKWRSIMKGVGDAGYVIAAVVVVAIVVFLWHRYRSYRAATAEEAAGRRGRHLPGASATGSTADPSPASRGAGQPVAASRPGDSSQPMSPGGAGPASGASGSPASGAPGSPSAEPGARRGPPSAVRIIPPDQADR